MLRAGALVLQGQVEGPKKALQGPKLLKAEGYDKNEARLFTEVHGGTGHKLKQERFRLDIGKNLFPVNNKEAAEFAQRFYGVWFWIFLRPDWIKP